MNSTLAALAEVGRIFAQKAEQKSQQVRTPKIDFSVSAPVEQAGVSSIEVTAKHPAVRAYEWGSGIHATKEAPGKYTIEPKSKNFLAFLWPKVDNDPSFRRLPDGRVLLPHVEHPGVEDRPFMKPTFDENSAEFRKILGKAFKVELLAGTKKVEVIEIK